MKKINILLLLILISCAKGSNLSKVSNLDYSEQEVKLSLPQPLWDRITMRYQGNQKFKENKYDFFEGIPLNISVVSPKKGVFNTNYTQIGLATFGANIDFAELGSDKERGPVELDFKTDLKEEEMKDLQVYYSSNSRRRKIDGEQIGNGCNVLLDLTSYFKNEVFKRHILLHTGQMRHISAVAGTFYFVSAEPQRLRISQVTFTDSRHTELTCEEKI